MLRIGDIAKECGLAVKALRHYEKLGLFKPYWIDRYTGYRYYQPEQAAVLTRIREWKALGFSLPEIQQVLAVSSDRSAMRQILREKLAEAKAQLKMHQARLDGIAASLKALEEKKPIRPKEVTMQIEIKHYPAFSLAGKAIRTTAFNREIGELWDEVNPYYDQLSDGKRPAFGVCGEPGLVDGKFEYIAGFESDPDTPLPQGFARWEFPEQDYAVFKLIGSDDGLPALYKQIYEEYLPASAFKPKEPAQDFEVYTDEFKNFAPDSVIYIWVPVVPKN
jgi:predicted transcriptional regulator YdeE